MNYNMKTLFKYIKEKNTLYFYIL